MIVKVGDKCPSGFIAHAHERLCHNCASFYRLNIRRTEVECDYVAITDKTPTRIREEDDSSLLEDVVDAAVTVSVVNTVCDCLEIAADAISDIFSND